MVEAGKIAELARAVLNTSPGTRDPTLCTTDVPASPWRSGAPVRPVRRAARDAAVGNAAGNAGEQEFEYVRPLRPGDVLTATSHVKDRFEKEGKRGGTMTFIISETVFKDQSGEIVAYSRGTTIQTSKAATP